MKAFARCLMLWLCLFRQGLLKCRPRGMDNGLSHSGAAFHALSTILSDSHSRCRPNYTALLFYPREALARGQASRVFEWLNMRACVCACVLCGNVGSACSPRAALTKALQTKCSPFSLSCSLLHSSHPLPSSSLLSGHCRGRKRRWCRGNGPGSWREVHE